jgi:CRISPR type III-A-associated RAMP protein Csm5
MQVQITTLTPLHIGSGAEFQGDIEYIWFPEQEQAVILDDTQVLQIIGETHVSQWISCIEKQESLLALLQQRKPDLQPVDIARRLIRYGQGRVDTHKPLREHLHSANGDALLPGSSLKGALRTAVWAKMITDQPALVQSTDNLGSKSYNRSKNREEIRYSDDTLNNRLFGKDPNHDIFRLLLPGDAHFNNGTALYRTEVVNLHYNKEYEIKESITQQVEAIPAGASAIAQWRTLPTLEKEAAKYNLFNKNALLLHPPALFPLVNAHTKRLLENEIKFWRGEAALPTVLGTYVDDLENVLEALKACTQESCVLRLGWGSGFRSMTGDWHIHMADDDYYDLVASLRPTHDETLQYPKTTRIIAGGQPLGFVRLDVQD